jgi:NADPH:quinone reductase-like Zn-dependent oxidoreductase
MSFYPSSCLQLQSTVNDDGNITLSLEDVAVPAPKPSEVIVRIEAAPINPSDLLILTAQANFNEAVAAGTSDRPSATAALPEAAIKALQGRIGKGMTTGLEGAGTVVAAGSDAAAQALLGKLVSCVGGEMYTQYRCLDVKQCNALPEGITARQGGGLFVNPMTALSMVETMRLDGHSALVLTAASSNLGLMVNKLCQQEQVPVVNIIRKPDQEALLREIGATHVVNSTAEDFMQMLTDAIYETGATLGFDSVGGGPLAGQILTAIENAALRGTEYNRYGSNVNSQVYISGRLDRSPITIPVGVGINWKMGAFLLLNFLEEIDQATRDRMSMNIAKYHDSVFASHFSHEISLKDAVNIDNIVAYSAMHTGEKFLINPSL